MTSTVPSAYSRCSCQIAEVRVPNCALDPVRPSRPAHHPSASATPEHVLALDERVGHVVGLHRDAVLVRVGSGREHLVVGTLAVQESGVHATRGRIQAGTAHARRAPRIADAAAAAAGAAPRAACPDPGRGSSRRCSSARRPRPAARARPTRRPSRRHPAGRCRRRMPPTPSTRRPHDCARATGTRCSTRAFRPRTR